MLRRITTVTGVFVAAILLLLLAPLWLVIGALVDLLRGKWHLPIVRLLGFSLCWAWLEVGGVSGAIFTWVIGRARHMPTQYALQRWWTKWLIRSLRITCGLRIDPQGASSLPYGPLVCLGRHASLGDALVSAWILGSVAHRFPRYVMKRELLIDPCLDIVGQRIPNRFVERGSAAVRQELAGIQGMATDMNDYDVAVIFPEGTRANDDKRTYLLERIGKRSPERQQKLSLLKHLVPPRAAGAEALLKAVPTADVVLMWHVGFDGLDTFGGILRRLEQGPSTAKVVFEVISRSEIPVGAKFSDWLDDRWVEIDAKVDSDLSALTSNS